MFSNDLFPTPVELGTLDDERLNVLMEWTESIREASESAGLPDYVQMCDERISAIHYEMVCRMCDTDEYREWLNEVEQEWGIENV